MLHGTGVDVPAEDGNNGSIVGFFTTRAVSAADANAAIRAAERLVLAEWETGDYSQANRGSAPTLVAENVSQIGMLARWLKRYGGYSFYTDDDDDEEPA